jgi:hypothetical protein
MKIKKYKMIGNDIIIYGNGKTIKPNKLNTLFDECEILKIKEDLKNNAIDNYLLNSWDVIYYIKLTKFNEKVFIFYSSEYDIVYKNITLNKTNLQ